MLPTAGTVYKTSFTVKREMVFKFAEFSRDNNPIHVSEEGANEYGFQSPVSHGAILFSEISRIIGTELPGYGALWSDVNINFISPVFWDETVDIEVEVLQSSVSVGIVKLGIKVAKQGRKILSGTAKVMCLNKLNRRMDMPQKESRNALITGGTRGLGLAVAHELLMEGYNVLTVSRKESSELEALKAEFPQKLKSIFCDLSNLPSVKSMMETVRESFGEVNVVVHAAGPAPDKNMFGRALNEKLDNYTDIYIKSLIEILDTCIPWMKAANYGRIVTIGTSYMFGTPPKSMLPYVIGKEALWGLTKCIAADFGKFGITANMVSPSMMLTDMTSDIPNSVKVAQAALNPINRLAEPEEAAKMIAFICGDGGTFMNGSNIPITGGSI